MVETDPSIDKVTLKRRRAQLCPWLVGPEITQQNLWSRHATWRRLEEGRDLMPVSKHRHKPGGKAIKHPGRGKQPKPPPPSPEEEAELAFDDAYTIPFHKKFPEPPHHAAYLLDLISAAALAFSVQRYLRDGLVPSTRALP
jgi:hypothetical protein